MSSLQTLVAALTARAGTLRGLGYRVQFQLSDTEESLLLDATAGTVSVTEGRGEADTVLTISSEDLARLIAGRLSPMLAFSLGRLKIEGSKGVAMKLASLLDED